MANAVRNTKITRHIMGDSIGNLRKTAILIVLSILFGMAIYYSYSGFDRLFTVTFVHQYKQYEPGNIEPVVDTSVMKPALGVPILMYHGIMDVQDEENTTFTNFVEHMEMLKREGFQTITLQQLEAFLNGTFTLPPRPFVLTFDDGRKDSYYPVDKVLEKLGYTASIFVATTKMNHSDPFYLSWDDLKYMKDSGRWDIQAHGRDSHTTIPGGPNDREGKYLTSRIYYPNDDSYEAVPVYEKRVEQDYINGIEDIEKNLGYTPKYFAIPLNEYGEHYASNYREGSSFNEKMIKKYFKLAFIEGISGDITPGHLYSYNLQDSDPLKLVRIEPINLTAGQIRQVLLDEYPQPPLLVTSSQDSLSFERNITVEYGPTTIKPDGLHLLVTKPDTSTLLSAGQYYWKDYAVGAVMKRMKGRSSVLIARMSDNKNYVAFGMTDNGLFLRERVNGVTRDLRPSILKESSKGSMNFYKMVLSGNKVTAYFNGKAVYKNVEITNSKGKVGLSTWSTGAADILVTRFTVHE